MACGIWLFRLDRFASGRTVAALDAVDVTAAARGTELETGEIGGTAAPISRLEVPWKGRLLFEDELRAQLSVWERRGIFEPGFVAVVRRVIENPEWLRLPGFRLSMVGAAAELSPLRPLLSWGVEVLAVDRPGRARWDRLRDTAGSGAGVMRFPIADAGPGPAWTSSVRESSWRTAAYRALAHFGVVVFDPATARILLAAKLVRDLMSPAESPDNPEALFSAGAAHGGLWRQPFAPRSLVAPAAFSGSMRMLRDRARSGFGSGE
ncbi:hypothetical protein GFY24_06765 [Nocardia sp. SYP-A9097]|uniref:hypothetical protein n=1 Tax=Nocardia sp. SYP-A9097 TaxID=2663237 RepID=UPI00129B4BCF|nr:hypothetical protein [Nocardia sp. SYP-A9097]MRH87164.1 hypothetical protein [Nocardia sp. SYP-A9097]